MYNNNDWFDTIFKVFFGTMMLALTLCIIAFFIAGFTGFFDRPNVYKRAYKDCILMEIAPTECQHIALSEAYGDNAYLESEDENGR